MKAYRKPQGAGAPQGVAEEKADEHNLKQANLSFPGIAQVQGGKREGQEKRGGPKAHAGRQKKA
jgi:hypothetical protein